MEISVIIPAFNEATVIKQTVQEVRKYLQSHFSSFEIIVVDDKSTDSTLQIVQGLGVRVFRNLRNHGKGYTVAKGVKQAQGDLILFMDADSSVRITELSKFLPFTKDYQVIIASRALPDSQTNISQNRVKRILGRAGNLLSRWLIDPQVHDTQCGFKLFTKSSQGLFDKLTIEDWGFDFELIFLARKYSLKVKEIGITWTNNFDSKVKWYSYVITLLELFKIQFNNLIGRYKKYG